MLPIFGLAYLFSLMLAFVLTGMVIHQASVYSMMLPEVATAGSAVETDFNNMMEKYGQLHRGFSHGAVHGFFNALFFALPLIGTVALFERRGGKYIMIHFGYWAIKWNTRNRKCG